MIIDGHVHVGGPFSIIEDLIQSMEESGINKSVLVPYPFRDGMDLELLDLPLWLVQTTFARLVVDFAMNNRWFRKRFIERPNNTLVSQIIRQHPEKFYGMYWLNPSYSEDIEEMEYLIRKGIFVGIKMHQVIHSFGLPDKNVQKVFDVANKYETPLFLHLSTRQAVRQTLTLAESRRKAKIIIAHLIHYKELMTATKLLDNIYFDISPLCIPKDKKIYDIVKFVGASKLIFGTDAPCPGGQKYAVKKVLGLALPEEQKKAILGDNVMGILN